MKFLIAATLMCLALFGQSQAGSLRGLAVPVPHQSYGVPVLDNEIHIEETQPIVEDTDAVSVDLDTHEGPKVSQPSIEYGAPAVANGIETVPFVDSLPLVDGLVNFGTPSETYGPPAKPTTPQPELPYLQPGLPSLPEAPVVPVVPVVPEFSEEHVQVSNEYLPPVGGTPSVVEEYVPPTHEAPVAPEGKPSEVYGPPATAEVVLPTIHEIPALPEAPSTVAPAVTVESSKQYFYEPPAIGFPTPISHTPEVPLQPATPFVVAEGMPGEAHEEHKPSELYGAPIAQVVIPELPAAPVTTFAADNAKPSEVYGLPATELPAVPVGATRQYFYEPPAVAFPTPVSVQPIIPEIKTEAARQYFYEVPAKGFPTPVTLPLGNGILSHSGFVQNSATSSSSSSSLHVNKYAVPLTIQPHADSVIVEALKPIGPGFAIHSVAGNSENTFNQVSVVNHLVPNLSSFGTIVGHQQPVASPTPVPAPHGAYGVPNF